MRRLRTLIETVGRRNCTAIIQGESGTGKELVARQVHQFSNRANGPFIPVDCTTLRDTLFESQLFGHVKGAFTGADQATLGFFRAADGGTLFLDEIGELDLQVQAKLLRCIQDSAVVPLGGLDPIGVDVRILTATHRNLKEMVRRGEFREDLYYRLNVVQLNVPPLRSRRDDVIALAGYFLQQQSEIYQEPAKEFAAETVAALHAHAWPGNVRELANAIEHAFVMCTHGQITIHDLPEGLRTDSGPAVDDDCTIMPLEAAERSLIVRAMRAADGNQARAAAMLQIERRRLYRKVRYYGLQDLTRRSRS